MTQTENWFKPNGLIWFSRVFFFNNQVTDKPYDYACLGCFLMGQSFSKPFYGLVYNSFVLNWEKIFQWAWVILSLF